MKLLGIPTLNFYEFNCSDELVQSVLADVKNITFKNNKNNLVRDRDNEDYPHFYHSEMFDWFDKCLLEVKNDLGMYKNLNIPIISCWANKTQKLHTHHKHTHPNSFISGIFYLTTHESGKTFFYHPNEWYKNFNRFNLSENVNYYITSIKPEAGKLIIFPSHVEHNVAGLKVNESDRYTIAFNCFFEGVVSDRQTVDLAIKVKTVRDTI